ncbi:MAG: ABC transporter permease [Acetobacteraceae bacterium]|nr:ABC transporter permease [Acetobacteraceae bacterium]
MTDPGASSALARPVWELTRQGERIELALKGDWIARQSGLRPRADIEVLAARLTSGPAQVTVSSRGLGRWDSALIVFVSELEQTLRRDRRDPLPLDLSGLPEPARRLLALAATSSGPAEGKPPRKLLLALAGELALRCWRGIGEVAELVGEVVLRGAAASRRATYARAGDLVQLLREAGADALGIVAICNGLVGAILAFVGAVQLRRFGAGIYVADLVGIATVREMAAVMTAIVMAGRTGGAYAAHLATMQGNEEIDALQALGIPRTDYLVLPRVFALVGMMPLLYLYACAVGLLGGFLVSVALLDITPAAFFEQTMAAVGGRHFVFGLIKSIAFGALIALAGCRIGLAAGRSAADVGRAATSAVVAGIIGVIALDAVFAVCANALGI